ncbi:putative non-specific serine/threonine protein kinase [Rosa chinensis]|uniref:Putative non-specific serine/threonine protein kinase n=1 Tax=Rosa chinensis TaxID=74649 RepID=A0A2P6Q375_ROSCH|nr:putative non-specific serine/threonine protein kinase [Rosa chinensis]
MVSDGKNWRLGSEARNPCSLYGTCGPFGTCNPSESPICKCLKRVCTQVS